MHYHLEAGKPVAADRLAKWALIGSIAVTAIYALTSLALPFGWDHGILASVGNSYVHGGLPYVDSWDMKGPISYLPFALTQALFGPTMWGIRIFDALLAGIASFALYRCVRVLTGWQAGAWAAFALYYWVASTGWFYTAAPEPWTGALCVLAVVPLLNSHKALSNWRAAVSGLLIGCVGLIKPLYLVVGIAPLLSIMLAPGFTSRQRAGLAAALAAGTAMPIGLMIGYFAWRGALSQAIEVHILYPFLTYAHVRTNETTALQGLTEFLARPAVALLLPFVALGVWAFRKQPQVLWPALGWVAALILAVAAQGKYFPAHWLPVYAPFTLLAALGVHTLAQARGDAPPFLAFAAALVFVAQVCALPFYDAAKCIYYIALRHAPDKYYASYHVYLYNAQDEWAAARYIKAHTGADDGIFVWGNDATVRYLADRPNPSRFTFEMPLSMPGPSRDRYRSEAIRELSARPPTYFVVGINWWGSDTKEQSLAKFPQMDTFLHQGYRLEKSFGVLDLYRRNASSAPPAPER